MADKGNNGDKDKKVTIVVHNEDSGRNIQVKGLESDSVEFYIDRLYEELKTTRKPDDRLRCESTSTDVFPFAGLDDRRLPAPALFDTRVVVCRRHGRRLMLGKPVKADQEIAAAKFAADLAALWATGRPERLGWWRLQLDDLHAVVALPAKRHDGTVDTYHIKLGAEYYDAFPPTAAFVVPESLALATANSRWLPALASVPPWFGLHPSYTFPGELQPRQLLCFTFTAEYYMTDHNPPESTIWQQGKHTVAATISRLAELLQPPLYLGPWGS